MFGILKKVRNEIACWGAVVAILLSSALFAQENNFQVNAEEHDAGQNSILTKTLTIEINPAGSGTVTKTPNKTNYDDGEKVNLKANPSGQYEFLHWSGDIDRFSKISVNIHMEENRTIVANFVKQNTNKISTPNKPTGKSNASTGEWINFQSGGANSTIGGNVEYLFDWGDGRVSEWGSANRTYAYGKSGSYEVQVRARSTAEPNTVSAWSAVLTVNVTGPDKHILTITVKPSNAGRVEIDPEKEGYDDGDRVTLRAIPKSGYRFVRWTDGLKSTSNPVNIYMLKTRSITANFEEEGGGGGDTETVSVPDKPTGTTNTQTGVDVQFQTGNSISSLGHNVEYQFDFGDGQQSNWGAEQQTHQYAAAGTYTVKARARCVDHTNIVSGWSPGLTVNVTGEQGGGYVLTVIADPVEGGIVEKDPDKDVYAQDEQVTIRAIPNPNYRFDHWSGDIDYRTTNPTGIYMRRDRTIIANFVYEGGEQVTPPDTIIGQTEGFVGVEMTFSTQGSQSSLGHPVEYQFDWGDGTQSEWGDSTQAHVFNQIGTYTIKTRARCKQDPGIQSGWYDGLEVTITELVTGNTLTTNVSPEGSGVVLIRPNKSFYAEGENVTLYAIPTNGNGVDAGNIYIEAETGTLKGNFWVETDTSASQDMYIYGTEGGPRDGEAVYSVTIETAGVYYIWGRCYALSGTEDSFFFMVDDGDTLTWHLEKEYYIWKWQKVSHQRNVQQFNLSQGEHVIKVIKRDLNARLDKLILTRDENFQPDGKMPIPNDSPYSFQMWNGDISGTDNPTTIVMNGDKNVTAYFISGNAEFVTAPNFIAGPDSGFVGETLNFTTGGAISNKGNPVEYQFDWGDGSFSGWGDSSGTHVFQAAMTYQIKTRARSTADTLVVSEWSAPFDVELMNDIVTPPTIITGPDSGFVGDTLIFDTGGAVSGKGNPVEYQFDWGDGNFSDWGDSTASHVYQTALTYQIKTRARSIEDTSAVSEWSAPVDVEINNEVVTQPTIITGPDSGFVGKSVEFAATGANSNRGTPLEYQFDWGDGSQSDWSDSLQAHVYSDSATYQVKARARSAQNHNIVSDWSASKSIVITFEPQSFFNIYVTISPENAGTVTVTPEKAEYAPGDTVELRAAPAVGYQFASWSGDLDTLINPITIVMTRDYNITANFSEVPEFVTVPAIPVGPDSGMIGQILTFQTTGAACSRDHDVEYQFDWGDSTLSSWDGNVRQHIFSYSDTMEVRVRARCKVNSNIISEWSAPHLIIIKKTFTYIVNVIVDPPGSGSVNRTPYKDSYESGEVVILSPLPATGFVFDHWSGDLSGNQNPEFLIIDGNKEITAHFKNVTGVEKLSEEIPDKYALRQNYPNPFNPTTTISFDLPKATYVKLDVYNIYGQKIISLLDGYQSAGRYKVIWNATDQNGAKVVSGIYFYKIQAEAFTQMKKMTLLK